MHFGKFSLIGKNLHVAHLYSFRAKKSMYIQMYVVCVGMCKCIWGYTCWIYRHDGLKQEE